MKKMVLGVMVAAISGLCVNGLIAAEDPKENAQYEVIIKTDSENPNLHTATATQAMAVVVTAEEDEDGQVRIIQGVSPSANGAVFAAGGRHPISLAAVEEDAENRGWLGVTLGGVSDELKEMHGDVEGLSILNVAKGSAAETAGFQQNDVIIEINDIAIGDSLETLVNQIAEAGPGARMKFTVMREGQRRNLVATLGSRAEMGEVEWVHDMPSEVRMSSNMRFHVLEPGESGNMWVLKGMDDDSLENLPEHVREMLRTVENHSVSVSTGDNGTVIAHSVVVDGETININREGEGPIMVTRIDADGIETEAEYADEEELEANDEDAFRIFTHHHPNMGHNFSSGNGFTFMHGAHDDHHGRMVAEIKARLDNADGSLQEMIEQLHNVKIDLGGDLKDAARAAHVRIAGLHQANRTIRENADGSIEVVVRKGGDELVTVYSDAADLEARNPDAFEKYQELQEVE